MAIISVSDPFIIKYWSELFKEHFTKVETPAPIHILCDPTAEFTKYLHLNEDRTADGLGINSKRYSAIIQNGEIIKLNVEKHRDDFRLSGPIRILDQLDNLRNENHENIYE